MRSISYTLFICGCICNTLVAEAPRAGQLHFGWAATSITPDRPVAISGQYHTRITKRVHDPVTATALAVETRDDAGTIDHAILVSCDLVLIRASIVEKVRERLRSRKLDFDPQKVIVAATHTHTAPALTDAREADWHPYDIAGGWAYRLPADREYVLHPAEYIEFLAERLAEVVVQAWQARKLGSMSWALRHALVAHNRRGVYADRTARMYFGSADVNFSHIEGASDHSLDVMFFWRDETLAGIVLNLYCPAQETEGEEMISADFWHETRELLRRKYGADLQVLALCGTSGDQSPHLMTNQRAETVMRERRRLDNRGEIARRISHAVEAVYEIGRDHRQDELLLAHLVTKTQLPVWQVSDEQFAQARETYEAGKDKTDSLDSTAYVNWRVSHTLMKRYEHQKEHPNYETELHFLRLGDVAIATNPFELYTEYGTTIKSQSPAAMTLAVQLASDCGGYLPSRRAVVGGGYSARIVDGIVGPAGGEVLVRESVKSLNTLWSRE